MRPAHRPGCFSSRSVRSYAPNLVQPLGSFRANGLAKGYARRPLAALRSRYGHHAPVIRPYTNNRSVRLPLCSCGDVGNIGWGEMGVDKFLKWIFGKTGRRWDVKIICIVCCLPLRQYCEYEIHQGARYGKHCPRQRSAQAKIRAGAG